MAIFVNEERTKVKQFFLHQLDLVLHEEFFILVVLWFLPCAVLFRKQFSFILNAQHRQKVFLLNLAELKGYILDFCLIFYHSFDESSLHFFFDRCGELLLLKQKLLKYFSRLYALLFNFYLKVLLSVVD